MYEPAVSLARILGPWVQVLFAFGLLLLFWFRLGAAAFCGERRLFRANNRMLWKIPFLILFAAFLYGGLRFSGLLLYPADGWDQWGMWNATNQNRGMIVLFLSVPLLIGTTLAVYREKRRLGKERQG